MVSSDPDFSSKIEYLKNCIGCGQKFYYHHKHDNYIYACLKIFKNLTSAFCKSILYSILGNKKKGLL